MVDTAGKTIILHVDDVQPEISIQFFIEKGFLFIVLVTKETNEYLCSTSFNPDACAEFASETTALIGKLRNKGNVIGQIYLFGNELALTLIDESLSGFCIRSFMADDVFHDLKTLFNEASHVGGN